MLNTEATNKAPVIFNIHYAPYQLYPEASSEGEDKRSWYLQHKYNGSEAQLQKYEALMLAYFLAEQPEQEATMTNSDAPFELKGVIANTLPAHRLIQYVQARLIAHEASQSWQTNPTEVMLSALYEAYFAHGAHPSSTDTLLGAVKRANLPYEGLSVDDISSFLIRKPEDEDDRNDASGTWTSTREACRKQASDGVDAVPHIVVEGKRRDFTLVGCKGVDEYVKALRAVVKESR